MPPTDRIYSVPRTMNENIHRERNFSFYLSETVKLARKIKYAALKLGKTWRNI